ncbi:hypothetical protein T4D_2110 [Trichinella pseudospiralis]|uniref:Uncharacterized protein n=1 Tax=Trichinella pseudospiralis TaxID=6337 RepID=A0A0V1F5Z3_TRIPS|nr:hypothetical protein T4D_2110 [Trichinella pseudospiralis]
MCSGSREKTSDNYNYNYIKRLIQNCLLNVFENYNFFHWLAKISHLKSCCSEEKNITEAICREKFIINDII